MGMGNIVHSNSVCHVYTKIFQSSVDAKMGTHSIVQLIFEKKIIFAMLHMALYPLVSLSLLTRDILLVLPDIFNMLRTVYIGYKFQFGYHHYAPLGLMAIITSILAIKNNFKKGKDKHNRTYIVSYHFYIVFLHFAALSDTLPKFPRAAASGASQRIFRRHL